MATATAVGAMTATHAMTALSLDALTGAMGASMLGVTAESR